MVPSHPRGTARLTAILDALPDGLVLVDRKGTVVDANAFALSMFQAPGTALVGRGLLDVLPGFDTRLIPGLRSHRADEPGRSPRSRTAGRRTDGVEFPVEVTSAALGDRGQTPGPSHGRPGDGLLVVIVRDLTDALDTEAELARSQRQTEMILRAAAEGVVGTDTDGRVVLVNPAAGQILGYRADELRGVAIHPLILARRADGSPFPYEESPLADTLRSGHKHRVRSQVLWAKDGERVPVDLTTAPVRDGDRLVGAVMTFTDRRPFERLSAQHAAELAERTERHATEREEQERRYAALSARHARLTALLAESPLGGPGRPDPEAEGVVEWVPREAAAVCVTRHPTTLGTVVSAGIDKASALTGAYRTRFAVHAPPVIVTLDPAQASTALAHLIADASGVTSAGTAFRRGPASLRADTTVAITAAVRDDELRIEICGPLAVNDSSHLLVARGIIDAHGGVLTTREHPRTTGLTHIVRIPHTPPQVPAAHAVVRPQVPVAGSWIIGAAVSAHHQRAAVLGAALPLASPAPVRPAPSAGRARPYAVPLRPSRMEYTAPPRTAYRPQAASPVHRAGNVTDDAAQQRIVHLLTKIRSQSD